MSCPDRGFLSSTRVTHQGGRVRGQLPLSEPPAVLRTDARGGSTTICEARTEPLSPRQIQHLRTRLIQPPARLPLLNPAAF